MRPIGSTYSVLISLAILPLCVFGQEDKYSLLTEPFVERPISMHKGQIQLNGAYRLSVTNGYFESDGSRTDLVVDGRAVVGHRYSIDLHYGILEFLEAGLALDYFKQGIRSKSMAYFDVLETLEVYELTEKSGLEDLLFSTTLRLPVELAVMDFGITGFYSLPVAEHQPQMPEHTFTPIDPDGSWNAIQYHFREKNGTGVPVYGFGGILKLRLPKSALVARGHLFFPQGRGTSCFWNSELLNQTFTYSKSEYDFLPQNRSTGSISLHAQPLGWIQAFVEGYFDLRYGGWFEQNNQRYAYPVKSYYSISTGFEIIVSPALRIHEFAAFPLGGENGYADLLIHTGISVNLMPF